MGTITDPQAGINLADQNYRRPHGGPDPGRSGIDRCPTTPSARPARGDQPGPDRGTSGTAEPPHVRGSTIRRKELLERCRDHLLGLLVRAATSTFTPCVRGPTAAGHARAAAAGRYPARAGMYRHESARERRAAALPRARGDVPVNQIARNLNRATPRARG